MKIVDVGGHMRGWVGEKFVYVCVLCSCCPKHPREDKGTRSSIMPLCTIIKDASECLITPPTYAHPTPSPPSS